MMSATSFLSIWISNTACTTMLLPIILSIVKEIVVLDPVYMTGTKISPPKTQKQTEIEMKNINKVESDSQ